VAAALGVVAPLFTSASVTRSATAARGSGI
jgi:hypothetical protein